MTSFWRNSLHWLLNRKKPEVDNTSGYGPFRLGEDYDWLERASILHDYDYARSDDDPNETSQGTKTKRRSEADWEWFWRCVLIASKDPDPMQRCKKALQICRCFYAVRYGGQYLWGPQ